MTAAADKVKEFKYTVDDIVTATGLQKPSIRIALRDSDFKKNGASWGWNNKTDFDDVLKFFKVRSARRPDTTPAAKKPAVAAKPTRKPKEEAKPAEAAKPTRRRAAAAPAE